MQPGGMGGFGTAQGPYGPGPGPVPALAPPGQTNMMAQGVPAPGPVPNPNMKAYEAFKAQSAPAPTPQAPPPGPTPPPMPTRNPMPQSASPQRGMMGGNNTGGMPMPNPQRQMMKARNTDPFAGTGTQPMPTPRPQPTGGTPPMPPRPPSPTPPMPQGTAPTPGMPPLPPRGGMGKPPFGTTYDPRPDPSMEPKGFAADPRSMPPPTMPQGAPGTAPTPGMPPLPPSGGISQAMSNLPNYVANGNRMGPPMGRGIGQEQGVPSFTGHQHSNEEGVPRPIWTQPIHKQAAEHAANEPGGGLNNMIPGGKPGMESLMQMPERNPAGQVKPGLPEFNASGRGVLGGANQVLGRNIQDTGMFSPPPLPSAGPVNPATGMSGPTNAAKYNVPGMPPPPGITPASRPGRQVNSGIAAAAQAAGPNQVPFKMRDGAAMRGLDVSYGKLIEPKQKAITNWFADMQKAGVPTDKVIMTSGFRSPDDPSIQAQWRAHQKKPPHLRKSMADPRFSKHGRGLATDWNLNGLTPAQLDKARKAAYANGLRDNVWDEKFGHSHTHLIYTGK